MFNHCKYILLNIPIDQIEFLEQIDSIDEAAVKLDHSLEGPSHHNGEISPELEFWVHCSNLPAWAEHGYNTRLLHSNISFPLLKELTRVKDNAAIKIFKEEIAKRFLSGYPSVVNFLAVEGYLNFLNEEEIETIKEATEDLSLKAHFGTCYALKNQWVKGFNFFMELKMLNKVSLEDLKPYYYFWEKLYEFFINLGDYQNSADALEMALELNPDIVLGWENLGHAYRNAGLYNKALNAYQHAIKKGSQESSNFSHSALVYEKREDFDNARYYSEKALKINPKDPVAKNILKRLKKLDEIKEIKQKLNR